jgi:hypothetical protein
MICDQIKKIVHKKAEEKKYCESLKRPHQKFLKWYFFISQFKFSFFFHFFNFYDFNFVLNGKQYNSNLECEKAVRVQF